MERAVCSYVIRRRSEGLLAVVIIYRSFMLPTVLPCGTRFVDYDGLPKSPHIIGIDSDPGIWSCQNKPK